MIIKDGISLYHGSYAKIEKLILIIALMGKTLVLDFIWLQTTVRLLNL